MPQTTFGSHCHTIILRNGVTFCDLWIHLLSLQCGLVQNEPDHFSKVKWGGSKWPTPKSETKDENIQRNSASTSNYRRSLRLPLDMKKRRCRIKSWMGHFDPSYKTEEMWFERKPPRPPRRRKTKNHYNIGSRYRYYCS